MATNSCHAVLNENQVHCENSDQCQKCGENYTSDKAKTIKLECEKCHGKPVSDLPHVDPFVQSEVNEQEEIGKQEEVVPKIEEDSSDDETNDEEGDFYNIISNVKVTLNEKVEGTVHPLPKVSKTNDGKFDDYDFE
jgi:predicted  nucleic acid-binding Zn-ribbon protein